MAKRKPKPRVHLQIPPITEPETKQDVIDRLHYFVHESAAGDGVIGSLVDDWPRARVFALFVSAYRRGWTSGSEALAGEYLRNTVAARCPKARRGKESQLLRNVTGWWREWEYALDWRSLLETQTRSEGGPDAIRQAMEQANEAAKRLESWSGALLPKIERVLPQVRDILNGKTKLLAGCPSKGSAAEMCLRELQKCIQEIDGAFADLRAASLDQ